MYNCRRDRSDVRARRCSDDSTGGKYPEDTSPHGFVESGLSFSLEWIPELLEHVRSFLDITQALSIPQQRPGKQVEMASQPKYVHTLSPLISNPLTVHQRLANCQSRWQKLQLLLPHAPKPLNHRLSSTTKPLATP